MKFLLFFLFQLPFAQADYIWLSDIAIKKLERENAKPLHGIYRGITETYQYKWEPETTNWQWWQAYPEFPIQWIRYTIHEFDSLDDIVSYNEKMLKFLSGDLSVDFNPGFYFNTCIQAYAKYDFLRKEPEEGVSQACIEKMQSLLSTDRDPNDFLDPNDPNYQTKIKKQYITYESIQALLSSLYLSERDLTSIPFEKLDNPNQAPFGHIIDQRLVSLKALEFFSFVLNDTILLKKLNLIGLEKLLEMSAHEIHNNGSATQKLWEKEIVNKTFDYARKYYRSFTAAQSYLPYIYSRYSQKRKIQINTVKIAGLENIPSAISTFYDYFLSEFQRFISLEKQIPDFMVQDFRLLNSINNTARQHTHDTIQILRERMAQNIATKSEKILLAFLEQI